VSDYFPRFNPSKPKRRPTPSSGQIPSSKFFPYILHYAPSINPTNQSALPPTFFPKNRGRRVSVKTPPPAVPTAYPELGDREYGNSQSHNNKIGYNPRLCINRTEGTPAPNHRHRALSYFPRGELLVFRTRPSDTTGTEVNSFRCGYQRQNRPRALRFENVRHAVACAWLSKLIDSSR
jgi:hypothetical protein